MKKPRLQDLTLRERIGQTQLTPDLGINFRRHDLNGSFRTDEETAEIMKNCQFGSFWMNNWLWVDENGELCPSGRRATAAEYRNWYRKMAKNVKVPMLCEIADEVGPGTRFPGLSTSRSALLWGATQDPDLVYSFANALAKEYKYMGGAWQWAPVLDITSRLSGASIGRTCAENPELIAKMASAYVKGMQDGGVAACAKHFPGHDPYEYRDSHICGTVNNLSLEEWENTQMKPFKAVIDAGVYSVMVGHGAFPAVDDTKINGNYIPSTLSYKIVTELLKNKLGFKGIVITDQITMGALTSLYDHEELIIKLLEAGNDIILDSDIDAVDIVEKAVKEGRLSEERINDACQRILDVKEKLGLFEDDYTIGVGDIEEITKNTQKLKKEIINKGLTLVTNKTGLIPLNKGKIKRVTIVASTHYEGFMDSVATLEEEFNKRGATVKVVRSITDYSVMKNVANESDLILFAGYLGPHKPYGLPSFYGDTALTYQFALLYGKEKTIGASFGNPYIFHDFMPQFDTYINAYDFDPEVMRAFVRGIYGEKEFKGISPVELYY